MSTYFETHPQKAKGGQWSRKRRNGAKPSGVVVIHTAESATDFLGPDPGAENVARYFATTTRYASYHHLSDSDSSIQLAPWSAETWHDTGTNNHSVGISAAIQCQHWNKLADRGEKIVKRMAAGAASYAKWLKATRGIDIPARKITAKQARSKVPGFLAHGTSDPGRRSDPGVDFDWDLFFDEYKRLMGQKPSVKPAASKPKPSGGTKAWPDVQLKVTGTHDSASHNAWVKMLHDLEHNGGYPYRDKDLTVNIQRWLKNTEDDEGEPYYKGYIDGDFLGMTTEALQRFLQDRGHIPAGKGYRDKIRGPVTIKGEKKYINSQARFF